MASDTELTDPRELLDEGWRVRLQDDRHDLAHDYFARSLEMARLQADHQAIGKALLAVANNLPWHPTPETENPDFSLDPLFAEAMENFQAAGDESGVAATLRSQHRNDESLEICRRIGDRVGIVRNLSALGNRAGFGNSMEQMRAGSEATGKYVAQIRVFHTEAIATARDLGDREVLADALRFAGTSWPDDKNRRRQMLLEAAELYRELGYRRDRAQAFMICAKLACDDDLALQEQLFADAIAIWQELGRHSTEAVCIKNLAEIAQERGDQSRADSLRARAQELQNLPESA